MNKKAEELKLLNTHFVTPHGLDNSEHYTTAYELAILTDYALSNKKFAEIVNTKVYTITINGYNKILNNTNELLGNLDGVNGVKTGFTNNAGRCLVTSVTRNNRQIISVVLGADTKKYRTKDSITLIEYVYKNFDWIDLSQMICDKFDEWKKENKNQINVEKGIEREFKIELQNYLNIVYPIKHDDLKDIRCEIEIEKELKAPLNKGEIIGKLQLRLKDETIYSVDVIIYSEIRKKDVKYYFMNFICNLEKYWEEVL